MKLPDFPLVDGCAIFDNSSLEKFRCPRAWQYSELDLKSPTAERAGANFGSTMHRGWETRYNLVGTELVDPASALLIESAMNEWLQQHPQPEQDFRNFNHACKMMRVYNNIYKRESFTILKNAHEKPIIENSFMLPFAVWREDEQTVKEWNAGPGGWTTEMILSNGWTPIFYSGKIDLGIEDPNGIWSFDHKTAFMFGDGFTKQMAMDGGQLGYCWALGQTVGKPPTGYIIDAVRVRRPTVKQGFTGESPIDGTDFNRTPYFVTPDMLAEWREDVMQIMRSIFLCHTQGHFPRHRWQCVNKYGMCEFYDVCSTPRAQRVMVLNSGMFEANTWSKGLKV